MKFRVKKIITEVISTTVEADTEDEAEDKFNELLDSGDDTLDWCSNDIIEVKGIT